MYNFFQAHVKHFRSRQTFLATVLWKRNYDRESLWCQRNPYPGLFSTQFQLSWAILDMFYKRGAPLFVFLIPLLASMSDQASTLVSPSPLKRIFHSSQWRAYIQPFISLLGYQCQHYLIHFGMCTGGGPPSVFRSWASDCIGAWFLSFLIKVDIVFTI